VSLWAQIPRELMIMPKTVYTKFTGSRSLFVSHKWPRNALLHRQGIHEPANGELSSAGQRATVKETDSLFTLTNSRNIIHFVVMSLRKGHPWSKNQAFTGSETRKIHLINEGANVGNINELPKWSLTRDTWRTPVRGVYHPGFQLF